MLRVRDMTQVELARKLDVHQQYINRLAGEHPARFNMKTLDRLCHALDCQPGDLLERGDEG
uniref:Putative DNA binding, helix-turn-helix domain containing protein n=1 Tax=viral metagenome TaxID=1070528 RepID=A0A6M3LKC7_9ZZZZ